MEYQIEDQSGDKDNFTIVPNYVINHSTITDQGLYLYMKRKAGENGLCFVTQKHLCEKLGVGKDKLKKSLDYLLKHGWIEFVGTTESKTRPINTYRVKNIWKLNADFYHEKISSKSALSLKEKDKTQIRPMIRPRTAPLLISNSKEDNNQHEAGASGIKFYKKKAIGTIGDVLKKFTVPTTKPKGATYEWQDKAVRWWKKLGLNGKPTAGWFRIFKINEGLAERSCSWVSDSGGNDLEKLTYWTYAKFKKEGKITYEKK